MQCKVCNNSTNNTVHLAKEMMFGFKKEFKYFQCSKCNCLQITSIPKNLSQFYPNKYYSFACNPNQNNFNTDIFIKQKIIKSYISNKNGFLTKLLIRLYKEPDFFKYIKNTNTSFNSNILDVGCGSGHLLLNMADWGFTKLTGIDPFVEKNMFYKNGIKILKKELTEITDHFDLIMLHHSLEHMSDPIQIFRILSNILSPNGSVLIRIPIFPSLAWEKYNTNWVQLDAPRHLFLFSIESIKILANISGFKIDKIEFDSTTFQFWGSEQYQKGIPLKDSKSYDQNPQQSIFTKEDIQNFEKKSKEANITNKGDQACIYLSHKK
jgi:2-polyprenyl-3-methyl-5-hydroxy-6-metoxy-1,4-benzoquinol methylase